MHFYPIPAASCLAVEVKAVEAHDVMDANAIQGQSEVLSDAAEGNSPVGPVLYVALALGMQPASFHLYAI